MVGGKVDSKYRQVNLGSEASMEACALRVRRLADSANGATWRMSDKKCFAEYVMVDKQVNQTTGASTTTASQTCLLRTGGCIDINKCVGHPKKRKCGMGLKSSQYPDSLFPCKDAPGPPASRLHVECPMLMDTH